MATSLLDYGSVMRVLVVGGTGLIGRHAAVALLQRGHEVRVLARRQPAAGVLPSGATFVAGDLEKDELGPALDGIEGLVHAGGTDYRTTPRGSAWEFYRRVNVDATHRLYQAAAKVAVSRAVCVTSFYHAVDPTLARYDYIRSRLEQDRVALEAGGSGPGRAMKSCVVQPPFILGRIDGRANLASVLARYVRSGAPLLAPPGGSGFMGASDLGQAIAMALEHGEPGARYLVGDESLTWRALLARVARLAGHARRVLPLPASAFLFAAGSFRLFTGLQGREGGIPATELARLYLRDFFYDSRPAQRALGYPTGGLDADLRAALR
jgi:nucleoside-diphosphate-sugar epimerase